jgi:hypothetical protein
VIELPICLGRQERRKSPGFGAPGLVGCLPWVGARNGRSKKIRPFSQRDLSISLLLLAAQCRTRKSSTRPSVSLARVRWRAIAATTSSRRLLNENFLNSEQSKTNVRPIGRGRRGARGTLAHLVRRSKEQQDDSSIEQERYHENEPPDREGWRRYTNAGWYCRSPWRSPWPTGA